MLLECKVSFHPLNRVAFVVSRMTCDCGVVVEDIRSVVQRSRSAPISLPDCCHGSSGVHVQVHSDGNRITCSLVRSASLSSRLAQLVGDAPGAEAARRVP